MNKFQFTEQINANTKLSFAHKALLNQILSFQMNNQIFHGTDEWLGKTWGVSTRTIKRQISDLKGFNLITVELERKKHTNGEGNWYNKRYITINLDALSDFLNIDNQVETKPKQIEVPKETEPIAIVEKIKPQIEAITSNDEYEYDDDQQEAWFNQMAGINQKNEPSEAVVIIEETAKVENTPNRLPVENTTEIRNFLMKLLLNGNIKDNDRDKLFGFDRLTITEQFELYEEYLDFVK